MTTKPSPLLTLSIPRAGYTGRWHDFVAENHPFFPEGELDRIGRGLARGECVEHKCHTNGVFLFVPGTVEAA